MIGTTLLANALRLPEKDVEALVQGRTTTILPQTFIAIGQSFALFPDSSEPPQKVRFWARCELCKSIDTQDPLVVLAKLTCWSLESLKEQFSQRGFLFVACLRVYELPEPTSVIEKPQAAFLNLTAPIMLSQPLPVLSDSVFNQRKKQLENWELPPYSKLEELQSELALLAINNFHAHSLASTLSCFLGWKSGHSTKKLPDWIQKISAFGNRTEETPDSKLSNYHAGTAFEVIVRDSLINLGFTVNESYKGGAGGIDAFCSAPYSLAIECKSGKSIPDETVEQLERIAKRHLKEKYQSAARLIIGPGKPTKNLIESADFSKISIMTPESLQKLVELNHKYPNSVNPVELQSYLQSGQIDDKIDEYIEKVIHQILIRSHIIALVKKHQETANDKDVEVGTLYGAYFHSNPPQPNLERDELKEILLELSSPLVGYLGRVPATDRFYFLRELQIS